MKLTNPKDVIALGSSCRRLATIVGQASLWRRVFSKIQLVERGRLVGRGPAWQSLAGHGLNWKACEPCQALPGLQTLQGLALHGPEGPGRVLEDRVRTMIAFLSTLEDSDAIFCLLHQMIYERYPGRGQGEEEDRTTVSFPSSPQMYTVSGLGLELLALAGREDTKHVLHKVQVYRISPSLLLSLASLQRTEISELVAGHVSCSTEEEGRALAFLLEGCRAWRVEMLSMRGQAGGQTWQRLARVATRGRVRYVSTEPDVVGRAPQSIFGPSSLW